MAMEVTGTNFASQVLDAKQPVLLDFYADWCMPCKMLAPVIDEIAREAEGFVVAKVNIDQEPELAQKFQVMSIPTLVVMKEGRITSTALGVRPKGEILQMLAG